MHDTHACRELTLEGVDVVVVGLQEVEMGTASVVSGAVKERINRRGAAQGNHNARWWADELLACLLEHDPPVRMLLFRTRNRRNCTVLQKNDIFWKYTRPLARLFFGGVDPELPAFLEEYSQGR